MPGSSLAPRLFTRGLPLGYDMAMVGGIETLPALDEAENTETRILGGTPMLFAGPVSGKPRPSDFRLDPGASRPINPYPFVPFFFPSLHTESDS